MLLGGHYSAVLIFEYSVLNIQTVLHINVARLLGGRGQGNSIKAYFVGQSQRSSRHIHMHIIKSELIEIH